MSFLYSYSCHYYVGINMKWWQKFIMCLLISLCIFYGVFVVGQLLGFTFNIFMYVSSFSENLFNNVVSISISLIFIGSGLISLFFIWNKRGKNRGRNTDEDDVSKEVIPLLGDSLSITTAKIYRERRYMVRCDRCRIELNISPYKIYPKIYKNVIVRIGIFECPICGDQIRRKLGEIKKKRV